MASLYLIESDNHMLINMAMEKILKDNNFTLEDVIHYDLEENNISDAIMDLDTYGLFQERKIVYGSNATFLTTTKSEIEHDINLFSKYINNPKDGNVLIISCSKLDSKKNICKLLAEKAQIVTMNVDLKDYIKKKTKGYKITYDTINYLLFLVGDDLDKLDNELNKLLLYKIDELAITREDIDQVVVKKVDDNIFDLIDAIIKKNKKKSLNIYHDMISCGEETFKIMISLANQIRLMYQVKVLRNNTDQDIKEILGLKNARQVFAIRQKISSYTKDELLNYLHKLSIMDEKLKLGLSLDKVIFPVFIANL